MKKKKKYGVLGVMEQLVVKELQHNVSISEGSGGEGWSLTERESFAPIFSKGRER